MSTAPRKRITLGEYEQLDRDPANKYEYFCGEVFAMVGGSPRHSLIAANVIGEARERLRGRSCVPYTGDLRIKVDESGLYTYPDASIICGELQLDRDVRNTALNPAVIVEVLSDSTERWDRGRKAQHYRRIPSLRELVLIAQSEPLVQCYHRAARGWLLVEAASLEQSLELPSLGIAIPLAEIYRNVEFDPPDAVAEFGGPYEMAGIGSPS